MRGHLKVMNITIGASMWHRVWICCQIMMATRHKTIFLTMTAYSTKICVDINVHVK